MCAHKRSLVCTQEASYVHGLDLYLLGSLGVYTLGVYSLGLPISGLDLYLLGSLGVYTLGLPISGLDLHMPVLKKRCRGPFSVNVV